jgi:hypothetical protein
VTDRIQQRGLPMVDVTQDRDHRYGSLTVLDPSSRSIHAKEDLTVFPVIQVSRRRLRNPSRRQ